MSAEAANPSILRGIQLRELGRHSEAAKCFVEALAQNPRDDFALNQLALCQWHLPDGKKDALRTIEQAISVSPGDPDHHIVRSFILSELGRTREALAAARTALGMNPHDPRAFSAQAQAHLHLAEWAQAEAAARSALALDPDFPLAATQLSQALRLQNKMEENAAQIQAMLARDPDDADVHATAGWSALQRGAIHEAGSHFREALRLDPGHPSAREGMLSAFRARSLFYRGYLKYAFWMQRLGVNARWAIILGLFVVVKISSLVFTGPLRLVGILITALYLLLCLWVWIAEAFGNFILLLDPFARLVLRPGEKIEACAVGGGLLGGLALVFAAFLFRAVPLFFPGIAMIAAVFPLSMAFNNTARIGAIVSGIIAAIALLGGLIAGIGSIGGGKPDLSLFILGITGALMVTWLGNFPFFRQRT
jgi:Flp pilus assembly protein TadD